MEYLPPPWLKLGCNPPPPPPPPKIPWPPTRITPRGDPSESDVPACALRLGLQGTSSGVPSDIGTPSDAAAVHHDDQMQEGDMKEATGAGAIHGDAQQCLTPQPPPPPSPVSADQDPPRGDPSESDAPTCALRRGPQGASGGVLDDMGAPSVADGVHGDDQMEERDITQVTGPGSIHGVAQECLTPHSGCGDVTPSDQESRVPLAQRPPQVMLSGQDSDMSSPNVHSSLGTAPTVMAPSHSSTEGSAAQKPPLRQESCAQGCQPSACCKAFAGRG